MDNKEAIERLQKIDFERSNTRDRLAIHHAITMLERVDVLQSRYNEVGSLWDEGDDIMDYLIQGTPLCDDETEGEEF